ncbi:MAG: carbonate dehydratase [Cytophagales bacterium]|jgi:carbonic anhydrase|nr:carbonate dehydratase [Cytophagales bacterium]
MSVSSEIYQKMLAQNEQWVAARTGQDAKYFARLSKGQSPQFLWIGCADSRVGAEEITQAQPGEIFVHRNIANLVVHTDLNVMSVVQYAVEVLHVQHIIVCGHYGCGGVLAAMQQDDLGLVNKWLRNIKEVYLKHAELLDNLPDEQERADRLVELNVIEQVYNLAETSIVQRAWQRREVNIHGWVFDMRTGRIKDLNVLVNDPESLHPVFRFKTGE